MNDTRRIRRGFPAGARLAVVLVVVAAFVLAFTAVALASQAPTTTASPAGGPFNNAVTVSLTATDGVGNSNVQWMKYSADGAAYSTVTTQAPSASVTFNKFGTHTLSYFSQDNSGNVEATNTATYTLADTMAPWSYALNDAVYSDTATISLGATDTINVYGASGYTTYIGSGAKNTFYKLDSGAVTTYTAPVVTSKLGDHTLLFYSVDNSGNKEATQTTVFTVNDGTAPVTTSNAVAQYNSVTAAITLTPSDGANGSGIAGTFYKVDSASTYTSGTAVSVSGLGAHTVMFYSMDLAGNTESPKTVSFTNVDLTAPTVISDAGADYVGSADVTITANDTGVGVAHIYYKLDGGATMTATATSAGTRASSIPNILATTTPPDSGHAGGQACTVCHTIVAASAIATITTNATVPGNHYSATPTVACTDCHTVVAPPVVPVATFQKGVHVATVGYHTLEFWADDAQGNTSGHMTSNFTVEPGVDVTPPVTTSDAVANYTDSATIHLTATDEAGGSGVATTYYKVDSGAYTVGTTINVTGAGSHTVSYYSVDVAGNTETATVKTFTITVTSVPDTTAPVTTSDAATTYTVSAPVVIHLHATDAGSGLAATYYQIDSGSVTTVTPTAGTRRAADYTPHIASTTTPPTSGTYAGMHASYAGMTGASGNCGCHTVSTTIPTITTADTVPAAPNHYTQTPSVACNDCHVVNAVVVPVIPAGPSSLTTTVTATLTAGSHTLTFWSADTSGNVEAHNTASFTVVPGTTPTATARLSKSPVGSSYTAVRHHGVANFPCGATLETMAGVPVGAGETVQLLKSADGITWKTAATMTTDSNGWVGVTLVFKGAGAGYWKWASVADSSYLATSSSKTKITVK